jgi:hypothetical protein
MEQQGSIALRELKRIGILCKCGTETIFDISKDHRAADVQCPCGARILRAQTQENIDFNWITLYRLFYSQSESDKDAPKIRFYVEV